MIEPALTAAEWSGVVTFNSRDGFAIHDDGDGIEFITHHDTDEFEKWKLAYWDREAHHAVAALCLRGMPFGFTREDLSLLRGQIYVSRSEGTKVIAMWESLADRIEALLPPEVSP